MVLLKMLQIKQNVIEGKTYFVGLCEVKGCNNTTISSQPRRKYCRDCSCDRSKNSKKFYDRAKG